MRTAHRHLVALVFAFLITTAMAQTFTLDMHFGTSAHPPNTLNVTQDGHDPVSIHNATYETRAFSNFSSLAGLTENYYSVRLGYYPGEAAADSWDHGIELELLHDKVYYRHGEDPGGVVQHFELSDGMNQALVNFVGRYSFRPSEWHPNGRLHLIARAGVGPVITAPATVIRGLESGTRTHLAPDVFFAAVGPGAQVAAQIRYYLTSFAALSLEAKTTVAHTRNPIADGHATATFFGAHVNFGMTFSTP